MMAYLSKSSNTFKYFFGSNKFIETYLFFYISAVI